MAMAADRPAGAQEIFAAKQPEFRAFSVAACDGRKILEKGRLT